MAPSRGIEALRLWLPEVKDRQPTYEAWMLSDMAKYADLNGDNAMALRYSARAFDIAQKYAENGETFARGYDYAALLLKSSRPQEAMPLLHAVPRDTLHFARMLLTATDGALVRQDSAEAHRHLQRATKIITLHQIEHLLPSADQLALQLASA